MRYIDLSIIDPNEPDVKAWLNKAGRKLKTLSGKSTHAERTEYLSGVNIWNEFKPILIRYFGEKCWYSECSLEGAFGDVDHFRPKNRSTDEQKNIILPDGYWWLAYDYFNYRLSCEKCNRSYGDGGKKDKFPLKPGTVPAVFPGEDDAPLLLDPCEQRDPDLIDCDESGKIISLSTDSYDQLRIDVSRRIYNWECFNSARRRVRSECKTALEQFEIIYNSAPDKMEAPLKRICELVDAETPYSSFAKKYIALKIQDKPYQNVINHVLQRV